jgi:sugar/nucleoside kinase (ribokinase family)
MEAIADLRRRGSHIGENRGRNIHTDIDGRPRKHRAFHRPVTVQTGRIDRERLVLTTRDAAEVLLRDWPLPESRKRARAMELCLSVIRGEKPPHIARRAFIEAAREARVLVEG